MVFSGVTARVRHVPRRDSDTLSRRELHQKRVNGIDMVSLFEPAWNDKGGINLISPVIFGGCENCGQKEHGVLGDVC